MSSSHVYMLSHFSRVRLCATPEMAAHQAPPSPGFSRQEHWSGLPFPSPMHESEKGMYVYIYMCVYIYVCVCVCVCVCVYKPHLLYLFLCWWIFRLFKVWEILDPVPALWWPTLSVLRRLWIQAGFPSPKNFHHSIPYRLPHLLPALNWCPCYWVGISLLGRVSEMWPSSSTVHQETRRLLYLPCGEKIDHSTDYDHL